MELVYGYGAVRLLIGWSGRKWRIVKVMDQLLYGIMFAYVLFWYELFVIVEWLYVLLFKWCY